MRMILTIPEDKRLVVDLVSHPGEAVIQIVDEPVNKAVVREAASKAATFQPKVAAPVTVPSAPVIADETPAAPASEQPAATTEAPVNSASGEQPVKRRGRPPGSKNKPKIESASAPTPASALVQPVEEAQPEPELVRDEGPAEVNQDAGLDEPRINPEDEVIEEETVIPETTAPRTTLFGTKTAEPAQETKPEEAAVATEEKPAEEPAETAPKSLFANFKRVVNEKE